MLGNGGLSGRISDAISNLTSIETLDLHDNDLKGSIPSGIGKLVNLSSFIASYNAITGTIPDGFGDLSNLQLLHIHGNRLRGTVPQLASKGHHYSSFISDCGSPSVFDSPLDCPSCTMCCNSQSECDMTEKKTDFGMWSSVFIASAVFFALLILSTTVIKEICTSGQNVPLTSNEHYTIGKDSVYSFFLSSNVTAWVFAIAVLTTQTLCFGFFIDEASLEFGYDRMWRYSFSCPPNNLNCRDDSEVTAFGWIFFALFGFFYLTSDMINGLKLVWSASKYGLSRKGFQIFFAGCCLFSITALALYATVVYNVATSRSNVDMIFNTVILLFVNELDENLFASLHAIIPEWLENTTSEIAASFDGNVRINVQYANANHQLRDDHAGRIKNVDKKLARRSNAIKTIEARHTKLKKYVADIRAKQAAENKEVKRVMAKLHEQRSKVEALEWFREQQNRRIEDIERNHIEVVVENKKLKEKVRGFEGKQAMKVKEMKRVEDRNQELNKKIEKLESELRNLKVELRSLVGTVQNVSQLQKK
mmetsp:Transcript_27199/g.40018  ORF Transcript_27199/g.40018 Transcript_27199/m.40018 type:complete len:534 (-) Transcript_27199:114-1715(-)